MKASSAVTSRLLLAADGMFGIAVAGSMFLASPWTQPLGPVTMAVSALPLVMWSLGTMLCRTEAELLAAVPAALAFHLGAAARAAFLAHPFMAATSATFAVLHCALYLPLPAQDAESNPFYITLRRVLRRWNRLLTQPVSGFGDSAE